MNVGPDMGVSLAYSCEGEIYGHISSAAWPGTAHGLTLRQEWPVRLSLYIEPREPQRELEFEC